MSLEINQDFDYENVPVLAIHDKNGNQKWAIYLRGGHLEVDGNEIESYSTAQYLFDTFLKQIVDEYIERECK